MMMYMHTPRPLTSRLLLTAHRVLLLWRATQWLVRALSPATSQLLMTFYEGDEVERELEGMWFPARVTSANSDGTYDVLYTDDGNSEKDVEADELRSAQHAGEEKSGMEDESKTRCADEEPNVPTVSDASSVGGTRASSSHVTIYADAGRSAGSASHSSRTNALERQLESAEAVRVPKVTVHGTAKARRDRAASAYVINGPETNVATGSGIRGIRWLQTNGNDFA